VHVTKRGVDLGLEHDVQQWLLQINVVVIQMQMSQSICAYKGSGIDGTQSIPAHDEGNKVAQVAEYIAVIKKQRRALL